MADSIPLIAEPCPASAQDVSLEMSSDVEDVFFTPTHSRHVTFNFPKVMAKQFEILQSVLLMQYEKDISLLNVESHLTLEPPLGCRSINCVPVSMFPEVHTLVEQGVHELSPFLQDLGESDSNNVVQQATPSVSQKDQGGDRMNGTAEQTSEQPATCHMTGLRDVNDSDAKALENSLCAGPCGNVQPAKDMTSSSSQYNPSSSQHAAECSNEDSARTAGITNTNKTEEGTRTCAAPEMLDKDAVLAKRRFRGTKSDLSGVKSLASSHFRQNSADSIMTIGQSQFFDGIGESQNGGGKQSYVSGAFGRINLAELSLFQRIVLHPKFDLFSGGLILANALVFAFKVQYDGFDCEHAIRPGSKSAEETWPGGGNVFYVLEIIFTFVFIIEIAVRIVAQRPRRAWKNPWIWFDSIIVLLGTLDVLGSGMLGINTSSMRLLRLIRLIRVFKILQSMSSFDSLFLLVKAIHASLHAMAFSFLLLIMIQTMAALSVCQLLQPVIKNDTSIDTEVRDKVFEHFGTFTRSMLTMFEVSLANWVPTCRLLVENVNEWWMLPYILYRCMFCFAVVKVISAVFITETNRILAHDDELTLMQVRRDKKAYHTKLGKLIRHMDLDGDGQLSWKELKGLLANPDTSKYLATLGFEKHDFEKLFWLLKEGESGDVSIDKFVSKVGKLKGTSKTIDTLALLKLARRIDVDVRMLLAQSGALEDMGEKEQQLEGDVFDGRDSDMGGAMNRSSTRSIT